MVEENALLLRCGMILTAIRDWRDFIMCPDDNGIDKFFQNAWIYAGPDTDFGAGDHDRELQEVNVTNDDPSLPFSRYVFNLYLRQLEAVCKQYSYADYSCLPILATMIQVRVALI